METDIFSKKNCFEEWKHVESKLLVGNYADCPSPRVSIIMPCYKRPDTFVFSLQSAIHQDCDFEYEIVVVDNNADGDKSPNQEIVEKCGAKNVFYYRNAENIGMAGNWNRGIELSRAEDLTFCHDDDVLLPNCLSRLIELRKKYKKECILSAFNTIDINGDYITKKDYPHRKRLLPFFIERSNFKYKLFDMLFGNISCGGGGLFRKDCMLAIGGYNNAFYPSFDAALHCSYLFLYGCVYNAVPTLNYRIGLNATLLIYHLFYDAYILRLQSMEPRIKFWPKCFLWQLRMSLSRVSKRNFLMLAGKTEDEIGTVEKYYDKRLIAIASYYLRKIKPYKFSCSEEP